MDRTREFLRLANAAASSVSARPSAAVVPAGSAPGNGARKPTSSSSSSSSSQQQQQQQQPHAHQHQHQPLGPTAKALQFNQRAADVSRGIQSCSVLLSRLTALARTQSLFGDDNDEVTSLTVTVKNEMQQLKRRLAELQEWLRQNDLGGGRDAKLHSEMVVRAMEYQLQDSGAEFVRVLERRKASLEQQNQRIRMFGGGNGDDDVDMGRPLSFAAPSSSPPLAPRPPSHQQQQPHKSLAAGFDPSQAQFQAQSTQMVLIPDHQHLRARVDAINVVQKHISELSEVMTTLATLVSDQDRLVDDIAGNVEQSQADFRAGFGELQRYYESIRGNRRLVARLFGVLVAFLVFFMLFLA